jgi:hypothetical protein
MPAQLMFESGICNQLKASPYPLSARIKCKLKIVTTLGSISTVHIWKRGIEIWRKGKRKVIKHNKHNKRVRVQVKGNGVKESLLSRWKIN